MNQLNVSFCLSVCAVRPNGFWPNDLTLKKQRDTNEDEGHNWWTIYAPLLKFGLTKSDRKYRQLRKSRHQLVILLLYSILLKLDDIAICCYITSWWYSNKLLNHQLVIWTTC